MTQSGTARSAPRAGARPVAAARRLRVVAPVAGGNGLFLAACVVLLLGGFVGVLLLNTAMAKGSYTMRDLQRQSDALTDRQDDLRHALDAVSGPGPLARRARTLGMVPAQTPAFLRLSDGEVLGVAKRATRDERFEVVTEPRIQVPTSVRATPTTTTASPSAPTARPSATPSPARSYPSATTR